MNWIEKAMTNKSAYDLSSGPAARAIRERELRREFRSRGIRDSRAELDDGQNTTRSSYDLAAVHRTAKNLRAREDEYVAAKLR